MARHPSPTDPAGPRALHWLLEADQPAVRYYALTDLLGRPEDDPEVRSARSAIAKRGWAAEILGRQRPPGFWETREPRTVREYMGFLRFPVYRSSLWQGMVLADLGLTRADPRIQRFADQVFRYLLGLSTPMNIYTEEVCIVGNTARMLSRFGYGEDPRVARLHRWMLDDQREDGGWNCAPGAPGTLDAWEALAAFAAVPKAARSAAMDRAIERGAEFYLERGLLREGPRYEPWYRLHYPTHYFYDLLVGLGLLTELGYAGDRRLRPALDLLRAKRRRDGTWLLDRIHPDVGRGSAYRPDRHRPLVVEPAGRPSQWITLTALRVLQRVADAR
jgi:hypothetical protein